MSIVLMLGALYGCLFSTLLWWSRRNRSANRFLAILLLVIALQLLPYIIGYAGFYDAFPWLSYLPYEFSLALGPLLYFYTRSLMRPQMPKWWAWHFVPALLQGAYYTAVFVRPLTFKNHWTDATHVPLVVPLEQLATFSSIAIYWALSLTQYRQYQRWLGDTVSDREDHHLSWLQNFLIALGLTLVLWAGLAAFQRWVVKLNYFQEFPFYLWLAVLSYYLGTEGWRHAGHSYPVWLPASTPAALQAPATPERSWDAKARDWRARLVEQAWWRDPELSLQSLARNLGTNTSDLSRAINEGLGQNFNELVNRLRVEAVQQVLAAGAARERGLLDIAFEAGFSSKASFNRCFKLYAGETPSAFAARQVFEQPVAPAQIIKTA